MIPLKTKSKNLATWLALLGGMLGIHRFYLYGRQDLWAYLWGLPTTVGLYGLYRALNLGQDDRLAWVLLPLGGLALSASALAAIIYGLMPDAQWHVRFNPNAPQARATNGLTICAVVLALMLGAIALVSTIAFCGQRFFEY